MLRGPGEIANASSILSVAEINVTGALRGAVHFMWVATFISSKLATDTGQG